MTAVIDIINVYNSEIILWLNILFNVIYFALKIFMVGLLQTEFFYFHIRYVP